MVRPKGSKSKNLLDTANILPSKEKEPDIVTQESPPSAAKKIKKTYTRQKFRKFKTWDDFVGPPLESFPRTKLPTNRVILQRFLAP